MLAEAFAKNPERFPNGLPLPRPLPTAAWINPPKPRVEGEGLGNTPTSESNLITIEAVRTSLEADPGRKSPATPNLNIEEPCMAVAQ